MPGGSTSVDYLSGRWRAATPARSQAQAQRPRCPSCSGLQRSSVTLRASVARSWCTEHKSCMSCNLAALASRSLAVRAMVEPECFVSLVLLFFLPGSLQGASNGGRRCATGAILAFGSFFFQLCTVRHCASASAQAHSWSARLISLDRQSEAVTDLVAALALESA